MLKGKLIMLLGFALGTVGGFAYGQKLRENAPSNVKAGYSSGVVTISADVGNLAKSALNDVKANAGQTLSDFYNKYR